MICSSVNLVRFIVRPQVGPDSNRIWRKNPGAGHRQPEIIAGTWKAARAHANITETDARAALQQLDPLWDELFPAEQARIVALLAERVEIGVSGLNVRLRMDGLAALAREITADAGAEA